MAANTLTNLINDLFVALDVVSRELVGFIPSVTLDPAAARAALNQTVRSFIAPAATAGNVTPGITPPDDGEQTVGSATLTITKSRYVPLKWSGEEQKSVTVAGGPGYLSIKQAQLAQAIRTLVNEIEADIAALHVHSSRAYGAAATTPFASTLVDPANVRKIISDNGGWQENNMSMVIDTTSGAKMRTLAQLTKANEAADQTLLRQGVLLDIHGFAVRESAAVKTVAAVGNNTGTYAVNGAHALGVKAITVKTGTGTILAGDVIYFGTDTANLYVVETGVNNGTSITLGAPGLVKALAGNEAVTIVAVSTRNMAFARTAIVLATRLPALPEEGDMADDRIVITDPRSGISLEVSLYKLYRQMKYELAVAWGASVIKPEHTALLLG
jgi:hypothetical protein